MDKFEQLASELLSGMEAELAKKLKEQYELGWNAGQQALAQELQQKWVGGHK